MNTTRDYELFEKFENVLLGLRSCRSEFFAWFEVLSVGGPVGRRPSLRVIVSSFEVGDRRASDGPSSGFSVCFEVLAGARLHTFLFIAA